MSRKVQFDIIDIAPAPVLPCLERPDDRVIGAVEVLPCMLFLEESQQLTCPHSGHRRRWTRTSPSFKHMIQVHTRDHKAPSLLTRQFNPLTCAFSCAWPR